MGLASLNPTGFRVAMDMTNHEANIIVCFAAGAEDCDNSFKHLWQAFRDCRER